VKTSRKKAYQVLKENLDLLNKLVNHFSESNDEFTIYLETKLYYGYEAKRWFFDWTVAQIAEHQGNHANNPYNTDAGA
jgi:hypothetical protein